MELQFDKNNNLSEDLTLSCDEFKQLFGFNEERKKLIENLFAVAGKLEKMGCDTIFVFGSFTSSESYPNDIDVCFDISHLDKKKIEKNYSLLDNYERRRYRQYLLVHVLLKEADDTEIIKWMKHDRNGNKRGILELNLKDLPVYDQK